MRAAVFGLDRLDDARMKIFQVRRCQIAAHGLQVADDAGGDLAFVEIPRSGVGQAAQRGGESGELQSSQRSAGCSDRWHAAGQPDVPGGRVLRQFPCHGGDFECQVPVNRHALIGQCDGRLHHLAERQAAESLQRRCQTIDMTRYRNRQRTVHIAIVLDRGPGEQVAGVAAGQRVVGRIESGRRYGAEVDHMYAIFLCQINHHESDAAQTAVPRLNGSQCKAGGDCGVHGIAAGGEDAGAGLAGNAVLRRHDAAAGAGCGLADIPVLDEVCVHDESFPENDDITSTTTNCIAWSSPKRLFWPW